MYVHPYLLEKLASLEQQLHVQNQLVTELSEKIDHLQKKQLEHPPPAPIEYNFEQLKIETLEGTLNIGVPSTQTLPFDQIDLPDQEQANYYEKLLLDQLQPHIHQQVPQEIRKQAHSQEIVLTDEQMQLVLQDLRRQLPERVNHYINNMDQRNGAIELEALQKLVVHIKKEINQGVAHHISHIKEHYNEDNES
ncbi:spore germination protein GerPC [Halalkalibacillus halophilus]|uniref:spore germination protein GerPC n=1 Tax=Halalkalibacillus halophilus TaxID=392827 RepID=UPI000427EDCD|nr:spore germination protein GerPC [Halalkalibacillus halophilus]